MLTEIGDIGLIVTISVLGVGLLAGFVKGAVGFAMPMIMISGLGSVLPPDIALAALILPTVASNLFQALRNGPVAAFRSSLVHWRYLTILLIMIALSAQLVSSLEDRWLFLGLGLPITVFGLIQIAGWRPKIGPDIRRRVELAVGALAGVMGGLSGVWGPPTVLYLTALDTPKVEHIRVQGVVYGTGSLMLLAAHLQSGVLNSGTLPLSAAMLVPCGIGLAAGIWLQGRMDQEKFRRATLFVLVVAGLNLIRRGLFM